MGFWVNRAKDAIRGAAEALFPKNSIQTPDYLEAAVEDRTWAYIELLPPPQRRLILILFVFTEFFAPLMTWKLGRYSKLTVDARCEIVRRFRGSKNYLVKLIGDSLKAVLTMMYMSHPVVIRYIGQYSVCTHADGFDIEMNKDALARVHAE